MDKGVGGGSGGIQLNVSVTFTFILDFFSKRQFSLSYMQRIFQDNFIFDHFFKVTTSTESFFRAAISSEQIFFLKSLFYKSHFFTTVIFSEQQHFQSETSNGKLLLENRQFFRAVSFPEHLLFGVGTWSEKRYIQKKYYFFNRATFSEQLLFQKT